MRVYCASGFHHKTEVKRVQALVRAAGHVISWDWTDDDATGLEGSALDNYMATSACKDAEGVVLAGAVILIGSAPMRGAFVEMGMALASGVKVLVVGDDAYNVFCHYRNMVSCFETAEQAVEALATLF